MSTSNFSDSPKQPLFGLCPKCSRPLVYNALNDQIVCLEFNCGFSRDYTAEDRANVDKAAAEQFNRLLHWEFAYGEYANATLSDELRTILYKSEEDKK